MQFNDRPIKREVQHILFTTVNKKGCKVTGLAGDCPEEYKKLLKLHFSCNEIQLVDFVLKGEGYINKPISEVTPTMVIDCDFCDSIINSGEEFLQVYKNMIHKYSNRKGKKVLSFTFSNRLAGGLEKSLNWLNKNLYENSLQLNGLSYSKALSSHEHWRIIGHTQSKFNESMLISYRDTSSMLSGIISWY